MVHLLINARGRPESSFFAVISVMSEKSKDPTQSTRITGEIPAIWANRDVAGGS